MTRLIGGPRTIRFPEVWIDDDEAEAYSRWAWARIEFLEEYRRDFPRTEPVPLPPLPVQGHRIGGEDMTSSAGGWWIEGMLRLVKAIDEAPDLTENKVARHDRETLKVLEQRKRKVQWWTFGPGSGRGPSPALNGRSTA